MGKTGGKKTGEKTQQKREKRMMKIAATNVDASPPPKRRPTGTPTSCANGFIPIVTQK